jgi:hypothetical protein
MLRKFGIAFGGTMAIVVGLGTLAADEKAPTIKEVMKATAGMKGLCAKCVTAGKGEKWEDAVKYARELNDCGEALAKCKCPRGDAASWEKLTKRYSEQTGAILKAAEAKDAKAFGEATKSFTGACMECHQSHKGKKAR